MGCRISTPTDAVWGAGQRRRTSSEPRWHPSQHRCGLDDHYPQRLPFHLAQRRNRGLPLLGRARPRHRDGGRRAVGHRGLSPPPRLPAAHRSDPGRMRRLMQTSRVTSAPLEIRPLADRQKSCSLAIRAPPRRRMAIAGQQFSFDSVARRSRSAVPGSTAARPALRERTAARRRIQHFSARRVPDRQRASDASLRRLEVEIRNSDRRRQPAAPRGPRRRSR